MEKRRPIFHGRRNKVVGGIAPTTAVYHEQAKRYSPFGTVQPTRRIKIERPEGNSLVFSWKLRLSRIPPHKNQN